MSIHFVLLCISPNNWTRVVLQPHVPSILSASDIGQILQKMLRTKSGMSVLCDAIVASNDFVNTCSKPFDKLMATKAEKVRGVQGRAVKALDLR